MKAIPRLPHRSHVQGGGGGHGLADSVNDASVGLAGGMVHTHAGASSQATLRLARGTQRTEPPASPPIGTSWLRGPTTPYLTQSWSKFGMP
jgi:hypothetical protein